MSALKESIPSKVFDVFNVLFFILMSLTFIYPIWHVTVVSFDMPQYAELGGFKFFPQEFSFKAYEKVFSSERIWMGYKNTIIVVVMSWASSIILTICGAYPLSKKYLPNKTFWTMIVVFTMFFSGGLIPNYLLVRSLGMMNTYWAMFFPSAVTTWNLIFMRNYFMSLPQELEQAAFIDGASVSQTLIKIIVPLSKPVLATVSLFVIVSNWNAWFDCLLYITKPQMHVLQVVLRGIIQTDSQEVIKATDMINNFSVDRVTVKAAAIMAATVPILCVYPFIQKYFVKGIIVGSLKG